jgi:hypothetical protein
MSKWSRGIKVVLISSLALNSCTQGKRIESQISQMYERVIQIDTDGMVACNESDSVLINVDSSCALKMVIWADSTECSQCYIRHLDLWKGYVKLERENPNGIKFFFILEIAPDKFETMATMIQSIQLNSIIYVDTTQHFRRHNPNIPSDVMFHTFLLDSDN